MPLLETEEAMIQFRVRRIDRNNRRVKEGLRSARPYVQRHEACQPINELSNHRPGDPRFAGRHSANGFDEKPSEQLRIEISTRALRNSSENVGIGGLPCQQNDLCSGTFRPKKGKRRGLVCAGHLEIQQKNMWLLHCGFDSFTNSPDGGKDRNSPHSLKKTHTSATPSCIGIGNDDCNVWHVFP